MKVIRSRGFRRLLDWLSGAIMLSGLWLVDEILTLAKYCGKDCVYPIPLVGTWGEYDVESFAWVMILAGTILLYVNQRLESSEQRAIRTQHTLERTEHEAERLEHAIERAEHAADKIDRIARRTALETSVTEESIDRIARRIALETHATEEDVEHDTERTEHAVEREEHRSERAEHKEERAGEESI